jgi:hypothetical protein
MRSCHRISVPLSADLLEAVRVQARSQGRTLTALVLDALGGTVAASERGLLVPAPVPRAARQIFSLAVPDDLLDRSVAVAATHAISLTALARIAAGQAAHG